MKYFSVIVVLLLLAPFAIAAVSVEDVARLSELKTDDQLIIDLINQEGLAQRINSADVVTLRERGVSEEVISAMLKYSKSRLQTLSAEQANELRTKTNVRSYYSTTKSGKKVLVATNLDENGQRMGPPPPPVEPEPPAPSPQQSYAQSQPEPREIVVTIRDEREQYGDRYRDDYDEGYYEEPYSGGIPSYGYGYGYGGYGYPSYFGHSKYGFKRPYGSYVPSSSFTQQGAFHVNPFGSNGTWRSRAPMLNPGFRSSGSRGFHHRGGFSPRVVQPSMSGGVRR
jgi:hypothetical protein